MEATTAMRRFDEWACRFPARIARMYARRLRARLKADDSVPDHLRDDPECLLRQIFLGLPGTLRAEPLRLRAAFLWVVDRYVSGGIPRCEDILGPDSRTGRALAFWAKRKNRIYFGLPDRLDVFGDLSSFEQATSMRDGTSSAFEPRIVRKALSDPAVAEGTKIIRDDGEALVVEVTNWPAARFWGSGTSWCTAPNPELCNRYLAKGPLYVLVDKHAGTKYQFHPLSGQFADERDHPAAVGELRRLLPGVIEAMEPESRALLVCRAWETGLEVSPSDFFFILDGPQDRNWLIGVLVALVTTEPEETMIRLASGLTDTSVVERLGSRLLAKYRDIATGFFARLLPHVREDLRAPLLAAVRKHILEPVQHDGFVTKKYLGEACISFLENDRNENLRSECFAVLSRLLRKDDEPWYLLEALAGSRIADADLRKLVSSSAPRKIASMFAKLLENGQPVEFLRRFLLAGVLPQPVRHVHRSCLRLLDADGWTKVLLRARRGAPSLFHALSVTIFAELTSEYGVHPESEVRCTGVLRSVDPKVLDSMAAAISRKARKSVTADDLRVLAGP